MTEQTQPTDAEILDAADDFRSQYNHGGTTFDEFDALSFARAVLAKWGTSAPVGVEPVARLEIGKTKGGVSITHIAEPAAFQLPEGMYALYTAPQPVALEPLTEEQREAIWQECRYDTGDGWVVDCWEVIDAVERAHGIKKGGQHGTE